MAHPNNHGYVTPYEPGQPICIRVFLNEDDSQFAVDITDVWGADPPVAAGTVTEKRDYSQCSECGHDTFTNTSEHQRWVITNVQKLDYSDGIVAFYRRRD